MAKLEVQIGAEIKELDKKLSQATKKIKNFDSSSEKSLGRFSKSTQTATKNTQKFSKGVGNGSSAMLAFSRTVQDAPFGLIGVSNNITNLTEQFGALKNRTGSAGGALKLMLKDLKGFGGITLAISAVTSLLLVFGDKIFATKDKVKSLKKEQDDLNKSLEDYVFVLDEVSKANIKGSQNATKELTNLRLLKSQIENTTLSLNKRKGAIDDLRKKYPDYLQNITDEKLLNGGLEKTYNSLTNSIIKRAKATASMNAIVKNSEQLLVLESQLASKNEEIKKKEIRLENATVLAQQRAGKERAGTNFSIQNQIKLQKELNGLNIEANKIIKQQQEIEAKNLKLEKNVSDLGGIAEAVIPKDTSGKIQERIEPLKTLLTSELQSLNGIIKENQPKIITEDTLSQFEIDALLFQERLRAFKDNTLQILNTGIEQGIGGFAQSIGNAIGSGSNVLKAAGASLLGTLGDIMVRYGKLAIAFGVASEALKQAFKNPFGGGIAAIAGGAALVAIGSAIKGFSSSVLSGGGGSTSTSNIGTSSSSSSSSGSSFNSSAASSGGLQNVVFVLKGQDLVGSVSATLRRNRNLGGSLSII